MDDPAAFTKGSPATVRGGQRAARLLARERQKRELRRERDRLVVSLAEEVGEQQLAEQLHLAPAVARKLLADARERLQAGAAEEPVVARRSGTQPDRWAEADAHFEAVGRGSAPPRRFRRP